MVPIRLSSLPILATALGGIQAWLTNSPSLGPALRGPVIRFEAEVPFVLIPALPCDKSFTFPGNCTRSAHNRADAVGWKANRLCQFAHSDDVVAARFVITSRSPVK